MFESPTSLGKYLEGFWAIIPGKHCSTGTIPAQYQGYCRSGTCPPLFYCHLCNSDLPFCTLAFYGEVLVNCYPTGSSQHNYITLPVGLSHMHWPGVGLAQAQYRIYYWHGIDPELFNQCQGNEHMPLCAPAFYRTNTISCFSTRKHLLCKGYTF